MPMTKCKIKTKKGWKWGSSGACYPNKSVALRQMRAIKASGWTENVYCPTKSEHEQEVFVVRSVRKSVANVSGRKPRPNPLRADPTRMGLIRRRFDTDVKLRFKALLAEVKKLIVEQDSFGLKEPKTFNTYCPTGLGGGKDPTCSPGNRVGIPDDLRYRGPTNLTIYRASDSDDINSDSTSFAESRETAEAYQGNPGYGGEYIFRARVEVDSDRVLDFVESRDPVDSMAKFLGVNNPGAIGIDEWVPRVSDKLLDAGIHWVKVPESYPAGTSTWIHIGGGSDDPELKRLKPTFNVFCPTGPGGGKDPSCSPSGYSTSDTKSVDIESLRGQLTKDLLGGLGTKDLGPIKLAGFRVGETGDKFKRGVFFSGDRAGAEAYASLHPGFVVKEYTIELKNALLAGHQNDVTRKMFGKGYGEMVDAASARAKDHVAGGRKVDVKIAREVKKRGYDGVIYLSPAAPAKTEIAVFNVFCATGPGGGIDPSCSPKSSLPKGLADVPENWAIQWVKTGRYYTNSNPLKLYHGTTESTAILIDTGGLGYGNLTTDPGYALEIAKIRRPGEAPVVFEVEAPVGSVYPVWHGPKNIATDALSLAKAILPSAVKRISTGQGVQNYLVTVNAPYRFRFATSVEQIAQFQSWLSQRVYYQILGTSLEQIERAWWTQYVEEGYRKGAGRAFDDVKKPLHQPDTWSERLPWYDGTRREFLQSSFGRSVRVEKVQLLAGRVFTELKGVTDEMSKKLSRDLTDGLTQGKSAWDIYKGMANDVGISERRSMLIARTELTRVHAEGQLDALETMGVEDVNVMVEWATAGDLRVCFPAMTLVSTSRGKVLIEKTKPGDLVHTRSGLRRVLALTKREYAGPMTRVAWDGGEVESTSNHLFWVNGSGWVAASRLLPGDLLQSVGDSSAKIPGRLDNSLREADNKKPSSIEDKVFSGISIGVTMPISAVALDNDFEVSQKEVNRVSTDLGFLLVRQSDGFEGLPDFSFDRCFRLRPSVTSKGTKFPVGVAGASTERLRACSTFLKDSGSPAFFGAMTADQPPLVIAELAPKEFPTCGALTGFSFAPTCNRAVVHSMRDSCLDPECSSTGDALFFGGASSRFLVASKRAVSSSMRSRSLPSVQDFSTDWAGDISPRFPALGVASVGAKPLRPTDLRPSKKCFSALATNKPKHKVLSVSSYRLSSIIPVYCLVVEGEHEFFAEGVLVHNCDVCAPLEGVVFKIDEARGMIPRHPNCRCAYLPANVGESKAGTKVDWQKTPVGQTTTKKGIDKAIDASLKAEGRGSKTTWPGADAEISKTRPKSLVNVFCPTGEGGGKDPSCSKGTFGERSGAGRTAKTYTTPDGANFRFYPPRKIGKIMIPGGWGIDQGKEAKPAVGSLKANLDEAIKLQTRA